VDPNGDRDSRGARRGVDRVLGASHCVAVIGFDDMEYGAFWTTVHTDAASYNRRPALAH
jgi:hypothetical protein